MSEQLHLQFEATQVLTHPGKLNVHACALRWARQEWEPYEWRDTRPHIVRWVCACGKTLVCINGGWQ